MNKYVIQTTIDTPKGTSVKFLARDTASGGVPYWTDITDSQIMNFESINSAENFYKSAEGHIFNNVLPGTTTISEISPSPVKLLPDKERKEYNYVKVNEKTT